MVGSPGQINIGQAVAVAVHHQPVKLQHQIVLLPEKAAVDI
jgi:hypothetical protein